MRICHAWVVSSSSTPADDTPADDTPADHTPADDTPATTRMPTSVRIAVVTTSLLAGLLLLNTLLTWVSRHAVAKAIVAGSATISPADAERFVLLWMLPYLILGLLFALSAWFLPRRHAWARWIGLAAAAVLSLLTLYSVVTARGITVASLLVLLLSMAAVISLLAPRTAAWVPGLRTPS